MLEHIEVENYQRLREASLSLGRLTVIVGPSGRGKSSLIRAIQAVCFNRVGSRFVTHGKQKARVAIRVDGHEVVWEKPRDKGATYVVDGQLYTRVGRSVPDDVTKTLGIVSIGIDKSISFRPQFHTQFDMPLLLMESSTVVARALAKITRLEVIVEAQVTARRDRQRADRRANSADDELENLKEELGRQPNVRRARNLLEQVDKALKRCRAMMATIEQATEIADDIRGALLVADIVLPSEKTLAKLSERVDRLSEMVEAVAEYEDNFERVENSARQAGEFELELESAQKAYDELVEELGACPLCGSTEMWGKHGH